MNTAKTDELMHMAGVRWLTIHGQKMFPMYADNGGLAAKMICYAVREEGPKHFCAPMEFTLADLHSMTFPEFKARVEAAKFVEWDPNGGALPRCPKP